jgi:predicted enzyme related to lactoylglutathione lyase
MSTSQAKFVWYELTTSDPKGAEAFYKAAVGWDSKDAGTGTPYTLLLAGDAQVAGIMDMPAEMAAIGRKPAWSGYIAVDDVDAMAARILQAGGKLLQPAMDIPDVGRFAAVADPQGATFNLFKPRPGDAPPAPAPGTPGTAGWHELSSTDWKASFEFYSAHFGWTAGYLYELGLMSPYQLFDIDGVSSGGMSTTPADRPASGWTYYFNVDSVDAAALRIRKAGGQVVNGPMEVPGPMWIVQCVDPQGASFALVSAQK